MKVLHLVYSGMGGATNLVFSILEGDKKKLLNQNILFSGPYFFKGNKDRSKKLNTSFDWVKTYKYLAFMSYISVLKKLILFKPKIIFLHNYLIVPCLIYKFFFKNVKIIYVNHKYAKGIDWKDLFNLRFHFYIDEIVVLNKETLNIYRKKFNLSLNKLHLIKNGVNINFFKRFKKIRKKKYFKIGMACRVNKLKKYDLILDSLLSKDVKNLKIKFSLAGLGEDLEKFKKRIITNKLNDKIKLEGNLNQVELRKWYNSLDLYIQASVGEGMSMSILEAMAMKVPVIGSNVTGIKNILGKEKFLGLLFNNKIKDLSKKINYFYYLNNNLKSKYINTQYNYIKKNNNSENLFKKYLSIIKN